jgi:hypothetical protein
MHGDDVKPDYINFCYFADAEFDSWKGMPTLHNAMWKAKV